MDMLDNKLPNNIKKKVKHMLSIVELLAKANKANKKLSKVERVRKSITTKLYPFSNEGLSDYFGVLNIKNKNVMVVGSSGDQALCSCLMGAREVLLLDTNPLTQTYFNLKIAALKNLNYEDFKTFFDIRYLEAHNYNVFNTIKKDLSVEDRLFWEMVYEKLPLNKMRKVMFGNVQTLDFADIPYLKDEQSYNLLIRNINKTKFIVNEADVKQFHKFAKQKNYYSLIMLSNIYNYINCDVFKDCVRNLLPYLTENGVLQAAYEFTATGYSYAYLNGYNYYRVDAVGGDHSVILLRKGKQKHLVDETGRKVYKNPYEIGIEEVLNSSK